MKTTEAVGGIEIRIGETTRAATETRAADATGEKKMMVLTEAIAATSTAGTEETGTAEDDRHSRDEDDDRRHRRRRDIDDDTNNGSERKAIQSAKQSGPLPDQAASFAMAEGGEPPKPPKEQPNWGTTGTLAAASNAVAQADGSVVTLKYHEPPEARKPSPRDQWKLFVFKDGAIVDTIDLGTRSCWLAGRDEAVVDLLAAHPSISKQHAVVQFRFVEKRNEFGDRIGHVKPYLLDLASANGTKLNYEEVAAQRYVELQDKDMLQFGHSAREYVVMLAPRT
ncbi:hypothetical protein Sste5346_007803 [Sporothrix stenoceras]|uniref:FHA domain-containing protein n=1 Tax=Sporothrix stenoceras TaxID=5173 RepID=A0ABR3YT23_9PEZI